MLAVSTQSPNLL